jgi:hypothetical protein
MENIAENYTRSWWRRIAPSIWARTEEDENEAVFFDAVAVVKIADMFAVAQITDAQIQSFLHCDSFCDGDIKRDAKALLASAMPQAALVEEVPERIEKAVCAALRPQGLCEPEEWMLHDAGEKLAKEAIPETEDGIQIISQLAMDGDSHIYFPDTEDLTATEKLVLDLNEQLKAWAYPVALEASLHGTSGLLYPAAPVNNTWTVEYTENQLRGYVGKIVDAEYLKLYEEIPQVSMETKMFHHLVDMAYQNCKAVAAQYPDCTPVLMEESGVYQWGIFQPLTTVNAETAMDICRKLRETNFPLPSSK